MNKKEELKNLVRKYNISNDDLVTFSGLCHEHKELSIFSNFSKTEKVKLGKREIQKKYNLGFLDFGNIIICCEKSPQITNENLQSYFLSDEEIKQIEKDRLEKIERLKRKEQEEQEEKVRLENLDKSQLKVLNELDKDGNGEVDVVEGDEFNLLLRKHQNKITEIDRSYIQQFVKISSYLKSKKENIQKIFDSIKDTPNEKTLNNYVQILKDDIHSYNLLLFNSLNMIVSLVEDDMITFYEIHERFDNLNIFDSKHERDVSLKLFNIGDGLKELMFSIEEMGRNIEDQLSDLSYVTQQSSQSLNSQLEQIDSSLKTNNLLTTINTYQTYKLRKGLLN